MLGKKLGFRVCKLPLEPLAWMNIAHWQSSSDQRNILRFARIGLLFGKGFSNEEIERGIVIGPNSFVGSTNESADLKYVGYSGESIKAGFDDLDKLEKQMESLGSQPLIEGGGDATATGKLIDEAARSQNSIQSWIRRTEAALTEAYRITMRWFDQDLPKDFSLDIFSDFAVANRATSDLDWLLKARAQGELDHETFVAESRRRGVLSDTVTSEKITENLADEGPELTGGDEDEDDQDPPNMGGNKRRNGRKPGLGRGMPGV
jgi:hypothetical protein